MYKAFGKRLFDVVVAIAALIVLSPIFLLVACLLFIANNKSVFFTQHRPGMSGELFTIIKFKTMRDAYDAYGVPLPDDKRLTKIGALVRKSSLDEIPQLINVLKGDMSLIGPRPLLAEYLPLYSREQAQRHTIRPGITGWAQINGRNGISWEKRFDLDCWYVKNVSFKLDLKIILLTIKNILQRKGISQEGHVTMEKFKGN